MAARPSDGGASGGPGAPRSAGPGDLDPTRGGRVLSVSPTHPAQPAAPTRGPAPVDSAGAGGRDGFLTPRVLDQSAFDDLAATLRALVAEARAAAADLRGGLDASRGTDGRAKSAVAQLSERLHVGARMLKAFQVQIDRVDAAVGTLKDHRSAIDAATADLDRRLGEFEAQVGAGAAKAAEAAMERFDRHTRERLARVPTAEELERTVRDLSRTAVAEIESYAQAHRERAEAMEKRTAELEARLGDLAQAVETAEVSSAAATSRVGTFTRDLEARRRETHEAAAAAQTAAEALAAITRKAAEESASFVKRVDEAAQRLETRLAACAAMEQRIESAARKAHAERVGMAAETVKLAASLRNLAERFAAMGSDRDGRDGAAAARAEIEPKAPEIVTIR
jgi:chromosome segregation ATPase